MSILKSGRIPCAMIAALSVASCGSDDDPQDMGSDTTTAVDFVGFVLADEFKSTDDEFFFNLSAFFLNASVLPEDDLTDTDFDLDVCEVDQSSELSFSLSTDTVSAGDSIVISNAAGTLSTLMNAADEGQGFVYSVPQDSLQPVLAGPAEIGFGVPAGDSNSLSIDITGESFPAFSNVVIERAAPLEFISATNGDAEIPTAFSWVAGESILTESLVGFVDITLVGDNETVTCRVLDDGNFEIPQAFVETLSEFSFSYGEIERDRIEVFQQGSSLLAVTSSSNSIEF